ncbi:urease accessory protein UreE [Arcobacteraceae bacterium]|nr:urease accessory protein UreE [Arcobacteraceae bacterium]
MIQKVINITKDIDSDDVVELSWFDMQKPNLSAVSNSGVEFMIKVKFTHLHENDILVCEDGHTMQVKRSDDEVYEIILDNSLDFARVAYEVGNRHQPVCIEENKITVLNDISLSDIIENCEKDENTIVSKIKKYFKPNGKAHHVH